MPGPWEKYRKDSEPSGPWQKYSGQKAPEPEGAGQAALEGFGNAATMGYLPQFQALTEKPMASLLDAITGNDVSENLPSYVERRDENIRRQKKLGSDFPKASTAGTAVGIGANAALTAALTPLQAATLPARLAQGAKAGAAYGALANPGDTEGEISPLQIDERTRNAAVGGAIGFGTQGLAEGVGAAGKWLQNKSREKAVAALGPTKSETQRMQSTGQDQALGQTLLDEGAIPIFGTPGRISKRVEKLKDRAGEKVGDLIKSAGNEKVIDGSALGVKLLEDPRVVAARKTPGMEQFVKSVDEFAETLASNGSMTLSEAQALRQGIDKSINFNKGAPDLRGKQEALYSLRTMIRDGMNDAVDALRAASGSSKNALKDANKKFSNLSKASEVLEGKLARDSSNRTFGLTDTIAAAGGMATGDTPADRTRNAVLLALLNKSGRSFGASMQARGAKALGGIASTASNTNPGAAQALIQGSASDALGRGGFSPSDEMNILDNPRLMRIFREHPESVENIQNPMIRRRVKAEIQRSISSMGKK